MAGLGGGAARAASRVLGKDVAQKNRALREAAIYNRNAVPKGLDLPADAGLMSRMGAMGKWGWNNAVESAGGTKMGLAKALGGHAIRGGVAGGAIGGVMEASQGGSFWEGAKGGAMNGAMGWGGWRMMGRMSGASTRNPLRAFGKEGVGGNAATMWNATGQGKVSKQAIAILNQKQMAGVTRMAMNK